MGTQWAESQTLRHVVEHIKDSIEEGYLAKVVIGCLLNTLETTVQDYSGELPYVVTGDIPAMWLRDSSAQLEPYVRFARHDPLLRDLLRGVIIRQARYILEDPYANAFNRLPTNDHGYPHDVTEMGPWVYERKFEVDSLAHPLRLWWLYVEVSGDASVLMEEPRLAVQQVIKVLEIEQDHERFSQYRFERVDGPITDTLQRHGLGPKHGRTGMVWSGFRPSDDATQYPYLIPAEMFLSVVLDMVAEWADTIWHDGDLRRRAERLQADILAGIREWARVDHPSWGPIWAYEVDGLGHALLMDDANVPSLLSLPFFGFCSSDHPIYQNTRRFVLSKDNPYYYEGNVLSGVGSPHTPPGYVWPLAVTMQALTSNSRSEAWHLVHQLARADAGTGLMHESVGAACAEQYTRPWFAWANSLFAESVLRLLGYDVVTRAPLVSNEWGAVSHAQRVRRHNGQHTGD
jgi:meiotically up-regulated gene 157 (Mug157) protein